MDSYNLTHTGAELDSAVGRALEGFAAADAATKAANDAAKLAEDTAAEVQKKLDNGEFIGPIGKSGVYVGSGEMPEGYTVQVDPTGDMLCYTAGESDSRYLRATEIRRPFTGGGITLTDADDAAFGGVTVLGATTETGTGDKGPDNPYALTGVQPASLTVCGRNMIPYPYTSLPSAATGISFADNGDGTITVNGTAEDETAGRLHFLSNLLHLPAGTYTLSGCAANGSGNTWCLQVVRVINGVEDWGWLCREFGTGITFTLTEATDIYIRIRLKKGTVINNGIFKPQLEFGTAATPYTSYAGQTIDLPVLAPLYGDGTVCDEYDAATGVETRRWGRVEFDGTEAWITRTSGAGVYGYALPDVFDAPAAAGVCTHFSFVKNGASGMQTAVCVASASTQKALSVFTTIATLDGWKAYLNAQATAGTPVTVVYQLDAPVVTQHGPQRIPTYPGYTNLMLDISAEGAVQYPISAAMQWDAKADKAAVYDRDTADSRFAGVLSGTASGPVAGMEDVSPTGALRRAAVLGATAETGTGEKGPDNPYTIAGAAPTALTVCGRNLAANPRFDAADQFSPCVYADCELQPNTKYTISLYVPAGEAYYTNENLFVKVVYLPVSNGGIYSAVVTTKPTISNTDPRQYAAGKGWILLKVQSGTTASGNARDLQIEFGDTATPYEPYTGQTIDLPALEPLYGDGTVNDEYDAATGVENRRWKRVVFDGTEAWAVSATGTAGKYRVSLSIEDILPTATFSQASSCRCSHYATISADNTYHLQVGISANYGTSHGIFIYDDAYDVQDVTGWKSYLAAQAAAGTPVTVVYQLDAPAVTQRDPARILPPAPVCRVFADAGGVDVGYNRDINIAFEQQQAEYIAQIKALDARIAKLETGQPAEPMT